MNNTPFTFKKPKNEKTTTEHLDQWKEEERKLWEEFKKYRVKLHDPHKPEAFEVVIREPEPERSPKALRGYWRLIGVITKYLNELNQENWDDEDVSDRFKHNIGFTQKIDKMTFWQVKYRKELEGGCEISDEYGEEGEYFLTRTCFCLGKRYNIKTKSLAKKKGCTMEDMNKLIGEILKFGAEIPDCVLSSEEERQLNKFYTGI